MESGYYYPHTVTGKLVNLFRTSLDDMALKKNLLNEQELQFLKLTHIAGKTGTNVKFYNFRELLQHNNS